MTEYNVKEKTVIAQNGKAISESKEEETTSYLDYKTEQIAQYLADFSGKEVTITETRTYTIKPKEEKKD